LEDDVRGIVRLTKWSFIAFLVMLVAPHYAVAQWPACGVGLQDPTLGPAEHQGIAALSNGGVSFTEDCDPNPPGPGRYGFEYQCVELIRRFYDAPLPSNSAYATATRQWRTFSEGAYKYYENADQVGLAKLPNGESTIAPAAGDILAFGAAGENTFGHVAIITQVTETAVYIIEQNFSPTGWAILSLSRDSERRYKIADRGKYKILGWLRDVNWAMFQHDAQQTGASSDTGIRAPLIPRWSYAAGSQITAAPTIVAGTVYVGSSDGKVHAVDALRGHLRWSYSTGTGPTGFSAALVSGDRVFISSLGGGASGIESSSLWVLKTSPQSPTGELISRILLGPPGSAAQSPVLFGGVIYVADDNQVWAIDAQTLDPVWPNPIVIADDPFGQRRYVRSTPAVTQNSVVVGTQGSPNLFAFDRMTGAAKWSAAVYTPYAYPSPSASNGVVYARSGSAGYYGELIAFDERTGVEVWSSRAPIGTAAGPGGVAIADGSLYTSSLYDVHAVDAATGQTRWTIPAVAGPCGTDLIYYSFFAVANGNVFVKSNNGPSSGCAFAKVYALSTIDGGLLWDSGLLSTAGVPSSADLSTPAVANGLLYFAMGSTLYAYEPVGISPE
jgi:outer membrane protein assembly factor BamB